MEQQLLQEGQLVGIFVVYLIIKKLCTPFNQTDAYKFKIIDEHGNVLRKRHTLKTQAEKDSYTSLDTLVFNIKRMIEKLPGGRTRLASFAAALYLIKEAKNYEVLISNNDFLQEGLAEFLYNFEVTEDIEKQLELVDMAEGNVMKFEPTLKLEQLLLNDEFKKMFSEE